MTTDKSMDDWSEIRVKLQKRFSKLTDANIDSLKGSLDLLSSKLQSVYGYAKEKADSEFKSFRENMHSLVEGDAASDSKNTKKHVTQHHESDSGPR